MKQNIIKLRVCRICGSRNPSLACSYAKGNNKIWCNDCQDKQHWKWQRYNIG